MRSSAGTHAPSLFKPLPALVGCLAIYSSALPTLRLLRPCFLLSCSHLLPLPTFCLCLPLISPTSHRKPMKSTEAERFLQEQVAMACCTFRIRSSNWNSARGTCLDILCRSLPATPTACCCLLTHARLHPCLFLNLCLICPSLY
jgi:hypothetical protein